VYFYGVLMKALAAFVLQGLPQAVMVMVGLAAVTLLFPPLGLVSAAVVGLVTLRKGAQQGGLLVAISALALAVLMLLMQQPPAWGLLAGLVQWSPLLLLALVLRYTSSWTVTAQVALAFCLLAVLLVYAFVPDVSGLWQSVLERFAKPALEKAGMPAGEIEEALGYSSGILTGILAASLLLSSLLALMLARSMQAAISNPGGFALEFRALRFGLWPAALGLVLLLATALSDLTLPGELITIIIVAFFLQGLAVIHGLVAQQGMQSFWLMGLYAVLIALLTPAVLLLAGLGWADAFVDFRHRLSRSV
jgi:hypothetical protein